MKKWSYYYYPCGAACLALAELKVWLYRLSFIALISIQIRYWVLDGVIDGTAPLGSKSHVKRPSCRTPSHVLEMIGCCKNTRLAQATATLGMIISLSIVRVPSPDRGTDTP
jgi:hypothetical protein